MEWFTDKPIIIPSLLTLASPFILGFLIFYNKPLPEIVKSVLPVATFILGQTLTKLDKKQELRKSQKFALVSLKDKLKNNLDKIKYNTSALSKGINQGFLIKTPLEKLDRIYEESIKLNYFSQNLKTPFLTEDSLTKIRIQDLKIDRINELINHRYQLVLTVNNQLQSDENDVNFDSLEFCESQILKTLKELEDFTKDFFSCQ